MKKIWYFFPVILVFLIATGVHAQSSADQNPNFEKSMEKYMAQKDELLQDMGTTVQDTYKAIDPWQDKKDARRAWKEEKRRMRHEVRLERARNPRFLYDDPFYWNNRFNYGVFYNSRNGWNPYFGWGW